VATSGLYRGFSTYEFDKAKTFSLTDIELVKMDLLNHIYTKKGERVMMPNFGTQIPEMVFEPLDEITLGIVEDELREVFYFDPRVEIITLIVQPFYDQNLIYVNARLFYIELVMTDDFELNIQFEI
jgi:phage baseplate assembly protein W